MANIPELQALCAREIAKKCREMDSETYYHFLRKIPKQVQDLIKAFPTNFIVWSGNEGLLNKRILNYYLKYKDERKYITEGYRKNCETGITRRKVIWRKCSNLYCDNLALQKIIAEPDNIYYGLCKECESFRLPHFILKKLHFQIHHR